MKYRNKKLYRMSLPFGKRQLARWRAASPTSQAVSILGIIAFLLFSVTLIDYFGSTRRNGQPPFHVISSGRHPFTPVPEGLEKTFWVEDKRINQAVTRSWRNRGWTKVNKEEHARVVWVYSPSYRYFEERLKPWQRFNHLAGIGYWNSKDEFVRGFNRYAKEHPEKEFYFNPPSFRLAIQRERDAFKHILRQEGGENYPWVLKEGNINQGKGITMLGPNTEELIHVLRDNPRDEESDLIIQKYICHEDTWNGRKYDVRMFWLVASVDPLIVLYHDGYVRIGNGVYDESDFSNTQQHLTTHTKLAEEGKATFKEFEQHIKDVAKREGLRFRDPVAHVRNQFKEAIGETIAAFKETSFNVKNQNTENNFGFYGADFVIDKDLDVWFLEPQTGCGMDEDYMFRVEMHDQMYSTMVDIVGEIWEKQDRNEHLLPLTKPGLWEYVYVDGWIYKYEGYQRSRNKKGCSNTKL